MGNIRGNLEEVNRRIIEAALRSGRKPEDVTLVAVSKTKPAEDIEEAMACGCRVFGENRVQELVEKMDRLGVRGLHWHMIGHLQANKVKYIAGRVDLIHSLDNEKLAEEIEKQSAKRGVVTNVLLEVNVADEDTKFGLKTADTPAFVRKVAGYPHIKMRGLMTVAPYTSNPGTNRPYFRQLRELLETINAENIENVHMDVLSMGMTGDYEVAIEEGATFVRVGTGIFGERDYAV